MIYTEMHVSERPKYQRIPNHFCSLRSWRKYHHIMIRMILDRLLLSPDPWLLLPDPEKFVAMVDRLERPIRFHYQFQDQKQAQFICRISNSVCVCDDDKFRRLVATRPAKVSIRDRGTLIHLPFTI